MIPQPAECLILLKKFNVPPHIIEHSQVVHRVALSLYRALNREGEQLDPALVEAGSLLHDIAKTDHLPTGESHAQRGAALLQQLGYPEVAEIVRQHVILDHGFLPGPLSEAAVVHYADKRVKHTEVVTLTARFHDLKERYGKNREAWVWLNDLERQVLHLERCIFAKLSIAPETLLSLCLEEK
jgi:uncharacterized protein